MDAYDVKLEMNRVFEIEPLLVNCGIGSYEDEWTEEYMQEGRSQLRYDHIGKIYELLRLCKKNKTINGSVSSYYLKHIVERAVGEYTSNGELIAAMIICGYKHKRTFGINGGMLLNAVFNFPKAEVKFLEAQYKIVS